MSTSLQRWLTPRSWRCIPRHQRRCLSSSTARLQQRPDRFGSRNAPQARPEKHTSPYGHTNRTRNDGNAVRYTVGWNQSRSHPTPQPPPPPRRESGVEIRIDGESRWFSPIVLRDLCGCAQCIDPSTKQKYRPTTDIPADITPRAVAQTESGVSISWTNDVPGYGRDHTTELSTDVLRDFVYSGATGLVNFTLPPRTLWDAERYQQLPDMSYGEYMTSDSALYTILNQLHTHGLAFLTDVPESETSVSAIAERIGPIKNTFYGYTWDVRSVPDSKNVAYTSQDLGFHMDLLYMEQPPHLQFLHCIRSSSAGGASLFTDSHRAAADLLDADIDAFTTLRNHPIDFHYNHPTSALYHFRRPVLDFNRNSWKGGTRELFKSYTAAKRAAALGDGEKFSKSFGVVNPIEHLDSIAWSPPFQAPMGNKRPQNERGAALQVTNERIEAWHAAAQKFNAMIHRPEMIYERMMRPGECVLFDNRRVLHARKAFEVGDAGKERWLRGAYLDRDPYMSKMRVLAQTLGPSAGKEREARGVVKDQEKEPKEYFEAAAAS